MIFFIPGPPRIIEVNILVKIRYFKCDYTNIAPLKAKENLDKSGKYVYKFVVKGVIDIVRGRNSAVEC